VSGKKGLVEIGMRSVESAFDFETLPAMKKPFKPRRGIVTLVLACITLLVLLLSIPASLRDAYDRGGFYLFSHSFIEDLPKRLSGPGRFRLILQPLVATILGIRSGIADARNGRPPFLFAILFNRKLRPEFLKDGFQTVVNLVLMGILLDSIAQWLILGASYPGAALVVGPVLITAPYGLARALANRWASRMSRRIPERGPGQST
jgi:hypothetical protein